MSIGELSHSVSSLTQSVESLDNKIPFGQLTGLANKMSKILNCEGELVTTNSYMVKLDVYISGLRDTIKTSTYDSTNLENMSNAIMLKWVLEQNSEIQYWYSRNKFQQDDHTYVCNYLWNGYKIVKYKDLKNGIILELKSEEITFYKGVNGVWNEIDFKIIGKDYDKFWEIVSEEDWDRITPLEYIKAIILDIGFINSMDDSVIMFGTHKARQLCDISKWHKYGIDIISDEEECRLQYLSVINAHEKVPQAGLQMYELCAVIGYDYENYKVYNNLAYEQSFIYNIGLNSLVKIIKERTNSDCKFLSIDEFNESIEDLKDELYKYEDGMFSKLKKRFYSIF